jgi:hypothetical protein
MSFTRWLSRIACAAVLLACADATDPAAPAASLLLDEAPPPILEEGGTEPTPAELAAMPAEFQANPTLLAYSTSVAFGDGRALAKASMRYFATNATQEVTLKLRYENREIAAATAYGEDSHFFPLIGTLSTTAALGVSSSCGHLADAASVHTGWHQFIVGGWKFLRWGTTARSSHDDDRQAPCEPPPPPPPPTDPTAGPDDPDGYEPVCTFCQQWLEFTYWGDLVGIWWECQPVDLAYCEMYL